MYTLLLPPSPLYLCLAIPAYLDVAVAVIAVIRPSVAATTFHHRPAHVSKGRLSRGNNGSSGYSFIHRRTEYGLLIFTPSMSLQDRLASQDVLQLLSTATVREDDRSFLEELRIRYLYPGSTMQCSNPLNGLQWDDSDTPRPLHSSPLHLLVKLRHTTFR
jgi:hypothetical protein